MYVCDRLVVPGLTPDQLRAVGTGELSLDALTRDLVRAELSYAFVVIPDGACALALEREVRRSGLDGVAPLLDPARG